ncbi:MAG: NUDIX hydrolase [Velocimicrobium sp.]
MKILEEIEQYTPYNEQEEKDKTVMINFIKTSKQVLLRENKIAHFTASSWVVNRERTKILMIFHNIFNSWSWTGGHADGEEDLLQVAIREAKEETGVEHVTPVFEDIFSLEIITVDGHEKRGEYVPSHLHVNITYLLEANEMDEIRIKEDENSGVKWFALEDAVAASCEPWMQGIYQKLNQKLKEQIAISYLEKNTKK